MKLFGSMLMMLCRFSIHHNMLSTWQAETTVINQCTQLLSPSADPAYVLTYISHSFPEHRQYLCAGAWILMHGHAENINSVNLVRCSVFIFNVSVTLIVLQVFPSILIFLKMVFSLS